jgi:hypothetical protein
MQIGTLVALVAVLPGQRGWPSWRFPNELLVTRDVAAEAHTGRFRFEPAGKRLPKGFDAPITLLTLERP